ncbi:VanZ family protein [Curtobacterium sp. GC_Cur_3]|uniref:VanZ family protein n=1 Tax=Curtobacterium sp. GC_Cur_3 TaxID=2937372 RepID=UPI0035A98C12
MGFAENVLLTAPLGFLVPALTRRRTLCAVLLVGLVVSVSIEVLQYADVRLLSGGRLADVNNIIANVLGVAVGYAVYRVFRSASRLHGFSQTVSTSPQGDRGRFVRCHVDTR